MTAVRRRPAASRWHWFDGIVAMLVLGIAYASLARRGQMDCTGFVENFLREGSFMSGSDALGNVFAYLLLGAALAVSWQVRSPGSSRQPPWTVVLAAVAGCALLSVTMEAVQACMTERISAWWDLVNNTLGGALGWFGVRLLQPAWTTIHRSGAGRHSHDRLLAVALLAALAWVVAETAPWLPTSDVGVIARNVRGIWRGLGAGYFDPWKLVMRAGEWLSLGLLLSLPLRRPTLAILPFAALAFVALVLRLLLEGTAPPSPELIVTLPVAALALVAMPRLGTRVCATLAIVAATLAVLAYQLAPGIGPISPFKWRLQLLQGNPISGIELASYFGWYAITVVAAGHRLTGRALPWIPVTVVVLAITEWLQTMLPGRTADLSPPLVALACGALAAGMLSDTARGRTR